MTTHTKTIKIDEADQDLTEFKHKTEPLTDMTDMRLAGNILLNRMHILNGKLEKNLMNLSMNSCKVKCKELFLQV